MMHRLSAGTKSQVQRSTLTGSSTLASSKGNRDNDGGYEDEDGDCNSNDNGQLPTTKTFPSPSTQPCAFCENHPIGKLLSQLRRCHYKELWPGNFIECQNCADYRS